MNACWSRFFLCKELSQVLIYDKNNATSSLDNIQNLFSHLLNNINDGKNAQISADNVTYFAAIEFLLPTDIIAQLLRAKQNGSSNLDIAKKMLVPEKIVDFRLSDKGCGLFNIK